MELGVEIVAADGGIYTWEEMGDFSHLPPHDRPPKYLLRLIKQGRRLNSDRSDSRLPIPVKFPGKSILDLHDKFSGKVAIFFNGESLCAHDLRRITAPTVGMNRTYVGHRTYRGPATDYLCVMDMAWMRHPEVRNHPGLINGTLDHRDHGYRPPRSWRMKPFSFDIWRDGFVPNTTGLMALQIAPYMGFTEIYCLGLHLGGPHYDGTESGKNMEAQRKLMDEALPLLEARGLKFYSCGGSTYDGFPSAPFEEVCE